MSRYLKSFSLCLLLFLFLMLPGLSLAQDTTPWSYLYVQPANPESDLAPYVLQLARSEDSIGLIFSENVIVTLFTEAMAPMQIQVFPRQVHVQSGGYRLSTTLIWSGTTIVQDEYNTQLLQADAFAVVRESISVEGLYGTRPAAIQGPEEVVVIGRTIFEPTSTAQPYESCGTDEDVKGVLTLDFAQESDPRFPIFQVLQLGLDPIRFALPSFEEARTFTAVSNNVSDGERNMQIVQIDADGEESGSITLRPRDSFDDLNALYGSMSRAGASIFPAFARNNEEYDPTDGSLEIQFQASPDCRGLARGVEVTPLEGLNPGLRYYQPGAAEGEGLGLLLEGDVVEVDSLSVEGRICFDQPGGAQGLVCADGWLMKRADS